MRTSPSLTFVTNIERAQEIYFALEAQEFDMAKSEFIAVIAAALDATGPPSTPLVAAAPLLLAACEAIQEAFAKGEIKFTRKRQSDSDPYHPASVKLGTAIAAARGEGVA